MTTNTKPTVAVHKFSSCDGCQLAFLNPDMDLLKLNDLVNIKHFAEAGLTNENARVDVAFIEGSISTNKERERIQTIRNNTKTLITIGACATTGGIQALRNIRDTKTWIKDIYAQPDYIDSLETATPVAEHVRVDFELWGCPINSRQVVTLLRSLLMGVTPADDTEKVCMECKRNQTVCTLVTKQEPCLGPVTRAGCGAICPQFGRDCYACYGPPKDSNTNALANRLAGLGLLPEEIARRFQLFNNNAPIFRNIARKQTEQRND